MKKRNRDKTVNDENNERTSSPEKSTGQKINWKKFLQPHVNI